MLSGRLFLVGCSFAAGLILVAGPLGDHARVAARRRDAGDDHRPVRVRLVQIPDSQERADVRNAARHRRDVHAAAGVDVAHRDRRAWSAGVDPASPADVRGPRRSDSRRHDALHPRPDAVRLGHRANPHPRRDHVCSAAAQWRPHSPDRDRRHRGRRHHVRHARRRVDDRADDPHLRHHPDAGRGAHRRHSLRGDGLHGRHDDLRRVDGVRRAAEPDHEGEPLPASQQRLLSLLRSAGGGRELCGDCLAAEAAARQSARGPRQHGRARRERRGRQVSPGLAPRRGDDAGGTHRRPRRGSGRASRSGHRSPAQRRVARHRDDPRGRAGADAKDPARPLRQRRTGGRTRSPLHLRAGRPRRAGVHGGTRGRRSARRDRARSPMGAESRGVRAHPVFSCCSSSMA